MKSYIEYTKIVNFLLVQKTGIMMTEKQRNELLTEKVNKLNTQKMHLQSTVNHLNSQLRKNEQENER